MSVFLNRLDIRVSVGYGLVATLWILFSDSLLDLFFSGDLPLWRVVSALKGLGFVLVTAFALFTVLKAELRKRDRVESALYESEQSFRKIADTAPAMLWITDANGQATFVSRGWYEFTGQTDATALDQRWMSAIHPEDRERIEADSRASLETRAPFQIEYRLRRADAEYRWVLSGGSPRYTDDGVFLGFVGSTIDITEHRTAQQHLQEAEILRRELEHEKELLHLKERFISLVSHEFRTPLSVIVSSTELVYRFHDRMPLERQLKHLSDVLLQAEFMVGMLDDVLTVNKARAGRIDFNPAPLDLAAFAQAMLERMQALDKEAHRFVFTTSGDLSQMSLDSKLLQHILLNLLSNAAKYSPNGGDVHLEVSRENASVIFRVRDHGIGIPAASLARVTEPFYRAGNTREIGGTGLGMTIVQDSVTLHRGTLRIESDENVGTTVTVTLPVLPPSQDEADA
jgi:PAS domain S-box-containing protein